MSETLMHLPLPLKTWPIRRSRPPIRDFQPFQIEGILIAPAPVIKTVADYFCAILSGRRVISISAYTG
jgi:hypothetical protein